MAGGRESQGIHHPWSAAQIVRIRYDPRAGRPQISGEEDTVVLDWATRNDRVVLAHDVSTMIPAMREQLRTSRCAPIVFVPDSLPVGQAIEEILLLDGSSVEDDWAAGVVYLPLR